MRKILTVSLILIVALTSQIGVRYGIAEDFEDYTTDDDYIGIMEIVECDSWVSLRSKPDPDSSRLAKVPLGALVKTWGYSESYYKCEYEGKTGFIAVEYIASPEGRGLAYIESSMSDDNYVYGIPFGQYYHSSPSCDGMSDAVAYSLSEAVEEGREPCPVCCADANTTVYGEAKNPYYHSNASCSGMTNPHEGTLEQALVYGLHRCPECWE